MNGEIINKNGETVELRLEVYTRPNLRDGTHEMFMFRGKRELDNIFDKKIVDETTTSLYFYYPETFCNIPELQDLINFIPYFYPNLKKCHIVTHSVYIIQNVQSHNIGIYDKVSDFPQTHNPLDHYCKNPNSFDGLWANNQKIQ